MKRYYTVVSREDKYKSKAFIDTFGYRGGDVAGATQLFEGLLGASRHGPGGSGQRGGAAGASLGRVGFWLGRAQQRIAQDAPAGAGPVGGRTQTVLSASPADVS